MFLDLFEFKVTGIDGKETKEERKIRFYSSGKFEIFEAGAWRDVRRGEIEDSIERVCSFYGIGKPQKI